MTDVAAAAQVAASIPDRSSWVAANAGSGKTRVLTERVARLLLSGTDPQKILCLTYTTAAAAEMQTRLFQTLGKWSMLDDAPLRAALDSLGAGLGGAADLGRARTLFARALETPGGLRIQTIHAFCDALLRRFPLEAGVAPQFRVLDDREARALREDVLDGLARRNPDAVAALARHLTGLHADPLLREIGHTRTAFREPLDPTALAAVFGVEPTAPPDRIGSDLLTPEDAAAVAALLPHLRAGRTSDADLATGLAAALDATDTNTRLAALEAALLTEAGLARTRPPTNAVRAANPLLCSRLDALSARVADARARRLAHAAYEKSMVLGRFARVWLGALDAHKAARGLLDFDDMIGRTSALLSDAGAAAWVLWRLDGGIDHILVDEAQDTSPAQWDVVRAISEEFFAGAGARDAVRTVFVVGDEKQSIYSFQGADPAAFGAMRGHFERRLAGMGAELARCELIHSFRSAPPILRLVDAVFAGRAGRGLDTDVAHLPIDKEMPGRVELWPFLPKADASSDEVPWDQPLETPPTEDPVAALARGIAATLRGWLDAGRILPGKSRAVRAGDVMILVQKRGPVFHAVIRELKRAGVPVAGADVLRIGGELAVQDILAVLRVAATPADDLSLATVLRSPLGGLSEEELFALAYGRGRRTLLEVLEASRAESCRPVQAMLADVRDDEGYRRPFELIQRILVRHGGRRRFVARLGPEAEDGIDALLDQAIAYESVEPPSLTGFLEWIGSDDVAVKRRVEDGFDQVRVMTVHGAKGLEAPIVILPETSRRYEANNAPEILRGPGGVPLWRARAKEALPVIAEAEEARRERVRTENMRLLYVALTRAERWLIVAGAGEEPKPDSECWHRHVEEAMTNLGAREEMCPHGAARVIDGHWSEDIAATDAATGSAPAPLPDWTQRAAPRPAAPDPPVSPSGLGGAHAIPGRPEDEGADARARGEAIHRLLEVLPHVRRAERPDVAGRLLADWPEVGPDAVAEVEAVLDERAFAEIFGPLALAEVDVTADLAASGPRILGRVDRLIVRPDRVLAVDFKSNRGVPASADAIPEAILRQMGAYRAALASIWPDRAIGTAVLWTAVPTLMPVPDALADAGLARAALLDQPRRRA